MCKTVIAFGELLWDLLPDGPKLGGAPFNFACRVNWLGDRGMIVSRVGRDRLGLAALEQARALEVDTTLVQQDPSRPTGTVQIRLREGEPDYFIVPDVAYDHIEPSAALESLAAGADCVCFGTLVQRSPVSRRTLAALLPGAKGALKLLDINLRKDCFEYATIMVSLDSADVLKLNDYEATRLAELLDLPGSPAEFCLAALARWSLDACVVTLGARGAIAAAEGRLAYVPGYAVRVADTVGSGDAFTAAFAHEFLRGSPLERCCVRGCALGAMVATQSGPTEKIAPPELEAFLASRPPRLSEPALARYQV